MHGGALREILTAGKILLLHAAVLSQVHYPITPVLCLICFYIH